MLKLSANHHPHSFGNQIKKLGHVGVSQADATVAGRSSDQILTVCSMEIDIAIVGVRVFLIQSVQPQNAREDAIVLATRGGEIASGFAAFELRPQWLARADFFPHDKPSSGRFVTASLTAQSET